MRRWSRRRWPVDIFVGFSHISCGIRVQECSAESQSVVKYSCSEAVLQSAVQSQGKKSGINAATIAPDSAHSLAMQSAHYIGIVSTSLVKDVRVCSQFWGETSRCENSPQSLSVTKDLPVARERGDLCQLGTLETFNYSSCKIAVSTSQGQVLNLESPSCLVFLIQHFFFVIIFALRGVLCIQWRNLYSTGGSALCPVSSIHWLPQNLCFGFYLFPLFFVVYYSGNGNYTLLSQ